MTMVSLVTQVLCWYVSRVLLIPGNLIEKIAI